MNFNSKFLNEAKELEARWHKTGLLKGIDKKYDRRSCAVLLESVRLKGPDQTDEEYAAYLAEWNKRMSELWGDKQDTPDDCGESSGVQG